MMRKAITFVCLFIVATVFGAPITKQRALKEAAAFITKNAHRMRGANGTSVVRPKLSTEIETPAYYVFNIDKQKGFVIVSGDDKTETILGYSDNGEIDKNNLPDGLKALLEAYETDVRYPIANSANRKARAVVATKKSIPAIVPAHWNQDAPYNNNLKGNLTGCVATAMAQVMYYHRFPASCGYLKAPSYTFSNVTGTTFQWDKMTDTYSKQYSAESGQAVADLMQYCGYSVKMGYSTSFSSAWITSIRPAMIKYFGYDPDMQYVERFNFTVNQWNDMMYNELREGRPVIYGAMTPEGSGHCFIIDGYEKGDFFHINWGWSGMSDGFYRLPELHPASAGLGGASGGYSNNQQAVIGIQPDDHENTTSQTQQRRLSVFVMYKEYPEYTRSNSSSAFANIGINYIVRHHFDETFMAYTGLALYQGDRLVRPLYEGDLTSLSEGEEKKISAPYFNIPADVPNGKYQICAVSKEKYGDPWQKCLGSERNHFDIEITDTKLVFTNTPKLELVEQPQFTGTEVGIPCKALFKIRNLAEDFQGPLWFYFNPSSTNPKATTGSSVHIGKGQITEVTFNFKPNLSGSRRCVVSTDDGTILYDDNITISQSSTAYSLSKAVITLDNVDASTSTTTGKFYHGVLKGSVRFTNSHYSNLPFKKGVSIWLLNVVNGQSFDLNNTSTYSQNDFVGNDNEIPVGTTDIPFEFKNLPLGGAYAIVACYMNNGQPQPLDKTGVYISAEGIAATMADGSVRIFKPTDAIDLTGATSADFENLPLASINVTKVSENPNCLYFVGKSSGTIPAQLAGKNVIVEGVADNIQLVNAQPYFAPYKFEAKKIAFKRTFTNGATGKPGETKKGWSTLILPFTATTVTANDKSVTWFKSKTDRTSDFWLMHFVEEDGNKVLYDYAQSLEANTPYIINMPKPGNRWGEQYTLTNKEFTFSADNVTIEPTQKRLVSGYDYTFEGTLTGCSQSDIYKLNTDGDAFTLNSTSIEINPFEAYFTMNHENTTETAAKQLAIGMIDGENGNTNGIDEMEIQSEVSFVIYNLNGMEVGRGEATLQALPHGVYIVNGRKIVK